ncbi:hypothetical protein [Streptomyces sp. TLI_185]|uniref:hypothetical protein n=1 Tax=Streptomyces sp. TLI_185 TaxID=2485151 RepID=UPI000F500586|nr:hypothetical protein [Streptomyces sp. TLI_185]RPF38649.1 hypothetical protein EDD92_8816 [Streptomyces sp. TLI_185]
MAYDMEVAKTVYRVGRELNVNDKVMLAAFETGIVESGMRNLNYGDRDSLGVFQQRPSQGWGTPEECMNPEHAARKFFEQAVPNDRNNPSQSAGQLAQSVQRSAYPARYDEQEGAAKQLLADTAAAVGGAPAPPPPGGGQAPNFRTWGTQVRVRKDVKLDATVVTTLAGPTPVFVEFQRRGDTVNAEGFSNPFWAFIPALGGFVSNIFIDVPDSFLPGVPER